MTKNMLIRYMATCFGFIKAIISPIHNTDEVQVMCALYGIPYGLHE